MYKPPFKKFSAFLGLEAKEFETKSLTISEHICTPHQFLYGGAGLALSVEMLENIYQRPLIWATTQFAGQAHPNNKLVFKERSLNAGKNFTQAIIEAQVGGNYILNTHASLGARQSEFNNTPINPPKNVLSPENYKSIIFPDLIQQYVMGQFEIRNVRGPSAFSIASDSIQHNKEPSIFWARFPSCSNISSGLLAFLSDIAPSITSAALGQYVMARSLDNSIRIVNIHQSEWVLCEAELQAAQNGIGHISQRMWTEQGDLMAIASQSYILKLMDGDFCKSINKA